MARVLDISNPEQDMRSTLVSTLHASGAETADGASTSVDLTDYLEALAELDVTAVSGTTPTMDIKFQTSDDDSTWYDLGSAFAQQTTTGRPNVLKLTNFGKYVRAYWDLGGTTPSFTFSLKLVSKV